MKTKKRKNSFRARRRARKASASRESIENAAAPAGMPRPGPERLAGLIESGYRLLERQRPAAACDMWLEAWDMLRLMMPREMGAIEEATLAFSKTFILSFWCVDLKDALLLAGQQDAGYFGKLDGFITQLCERLPKTSRIVLANIKLARAEALYSQGKLERFGQALEEIISEFSDFFAGDCLCYAGRCASPPGPDKAA
ncbi:MAG: hypothetical protein ABIJ56_06485 [Pseudomonadota bacterium]